MIRRLASAAALASVTLLALVGCAGTLEPEPTPSTTTTAAAEPAPEELAAHARDAFEGFFSEIDAQFADGEPSAPALSRYAVDEVAAEYAAAIETSLARGHVSRGVPRLLEFEVVDQSDDVLSAIVCADSSGITTTDEQGLQRPGAGILRWNASFVLAGDTVLIRSLEPSADSARCGA